MSALVRVEAPYAVMICRACALTVDADLGEDQGNLAHLGYEGSADGWPHAPVWLTPEEFAQYVPLVPGVHLAA